MSESSSPQVSALDRLLFKIETSLNFIAACSVFVLMLVGVAEVVCRKLLGTSVPAYIDLVEQSIAIFAFLGVAYCQSVGGHIRTELLLRRMRRRTLYGVEALTTFGALAIIAFLIVGSFDHFLRAYQIGDSTINAELPVWPSKLLVPIAFGVLWLRLLLQFWGFVRLHRQEPSTGRH